MLTPGPLPRGLCGTCGRDVALRKDGSLREHRNGEGKECPAYEHAGLCPCWRCVLEREQAVTR